MKGLVQLALLTALLLHSATSQSSVAATTTPVSSSTPPATTVTSIATPGAGGPSTTAPGASTAAPGPSSTSAPGPSATAAPGPSATAAPGPSSTAAPGPSATAAPGASTTAAPGASTTAAPGASTTAAPGPSTTAAPGASTAAPGPSATAAPGPSATAAPGPSATAAPGPSATAAPGPSATAAPGPSATAAPGPSATAAPGPSTAVPGAGGASSAAPVVSSTEPGASSATPGTGGASTTAPGATGASTTQLSISSGMTPTPGPSLQPQTTTGPTNPCENANCKNGSTCVALYSAYFCLCTEGFYYNDSALTCEEGKIFPGSLRMIKSETSDLEDKNSEVYQNLHKSTTEFFKNAFKASNASSDYGQTVINKVSMSSSTRSGMRAGNAIAVGVVNILVKSTSINENSVSTIIDNAIKNNTLGISSYSGQSLCDYYGCQQNEDGCSNGFNCKCRPGLQRPNSQVPFCLASCPSDCTENNKKYCLTEDNAKAECLCLAGYWNNSGVCEMCSFGYTGVNCEDPFQLILTIVGTIAGFLILSLLIALIVSSRLKNKRKNIEEENLIGNDFQNLRLQQTGFSNPVADSYQSGSIFPKIRTANPGKNQLENPYVSQRPMPRPDY